jgi:pyruvate formate lyase activating enzyme
VAEVHLLPFHQYGEPKYSLLEREWTMAGVKAPEEAEIALIKAMVERAGYRVVVGG